MGEERWRGRESGGGKVEGEGRKAEGEGGRREPSNMFSALRNRHPPFLSGEKTIDDNLVSQATFR